MAAEALVAAVKNIVTLMKSGKQVEAYAGYAALFKSPEFATYPPADQRSTLKFMILAKGMPQIPTPPIIEAHRAAIAPLLALTSADKDPADYELLGCCQQVVGDEKAARDSFQTGLTIERAKNPQSPMCGTLMKRVASV